MGKEVGAAHHPTIHKTAPTKKYPAANINSAITEILRIAITQKPCYTSSPEKAFTTKMQVSFVLAKKVVAT